MLVPGSTFRYLFKWYAQADEKKKFLTFLFEQFISFCGAGMLGLPYAFRLAGVVEGTKGVKWKGATCFELCVLEKWLFVEQWSG